MTNTATTPPTAAPTAQYRVVWPMIQIQGHAGPTYETPERTLRRGDVVPAWVPTTEVDRLAAGGFIEAQS